MAYKLTDFNIIFRQSLDSTNALAKEISITDKSNQAILIYTNFQTKGKGQKNNLWHSKKSKNVLMSLSFKPKNVLASEQFFISKALCVSIIKVLSDFVDRPELFMVKWPNDIYWKDKKLGGILVENTIMGNIIENSVCGLGLNINQQYFPENLPNPISLINICSNKSDIKSLVEKVAIEFMNNMTELDLENIDKSYYSKLYLKDIEREYFINGNRMLLRIIDVDKFGRLILLDKSNRRIICNHGEIDFNL